MFGVRKREGAARGRGASEGGSRDCREQERLDEERRREEEEYFRNEEERRRQDEERERSYR